MTRPGDPYRDFTRKFFDRWSPLYDVFAKPIAFAYARAVRAAGAAPGRTILDLCTGTGEIAIRCARAGAEVTAIDMTPSMLDRARAKGRGRGIRFALMDARHLAFEELADGKKYHARQPLGVDPDVKVHLVIEKPEPATADH